MITISVYYTEIANICNMIVIFKAMQFNITLCTFGVIPHPNFKASITFTMYAASKSSIG